MIEMYGPMERSERNPPHVLMKLCKNCICLHILRVFHLTFGIAAPFDNIY